MVLQEVDSERPQAMLYILLSESDSHKCKIGSAVGKLLLAVAGVRTLQVS